jgi:hypothetical protein
MSAPITLLCTVVLAGSARAAPAPLSPIGVHSMLYSDHPFTAKAAMFREAAAVGASTIRLDISMSGVFPTPFGAPDWTGVDEYMTLARRYHLRVLADLLATPWYEQDCPPNVDPDLTYRCPPSNPALWGKQAGLIAAHTRGVIDDFEIINEPDGGWAFYGSPRQYAPILAAADRAIHAADPAARVALGGLMNISAKAWIDTVLATLGATATRDFDIANIHIRTPAGLTGRIVRRWRRYFASRGFTGPLWVTETGYPADPTWQTEAGYRDGPLAQARWIGAAVPGMICAGASMVFLTERDSLSGPYASEGFLKVTDPLPAFPTYVRRPSFDTIRRLARPGLWRGTARNGECAPSRHARRASRYRRAVRRDKRDRQALGVRRGR